ncbi:hypothetical protein BBJ29_003908 [Phytophthora kernoviae]|uniref:Lipase-like C-terminal domain-containing protein n=1 Tax=Phytophthora kernoviae TaxID=325452 RepID=A0A3F2RII0_9STRA|nr:hypothetical protein BBJ29_003908 [Phytophthora kernoviae]RLN57710.1 hypothetical protein BBP00_00007396 [Phytophthora kernoviae]
MSTVLRLATLLIVATLSPTVTQADNSYPIILVNGFSGWGRDELLGFRYWGGIQGDFQEELVAQGYKVYTAAVGPFSSNWDRACELYTTIKGGQVDYGAKHSVAHSHLRYGRNYTGLYPEWGNTNSDGSIKKVHLIGHSMGGQTVRMLAQLLEHGTTGAPIEEDASSHPLFNGGKKWVHSITTISTPNQGTTLGDGFSQIGDSVKDLLAGVLNVVGILGNSAQMVYDAKLDQWGITNKQSGETLQNYLKRVFSSSIFDSSFKDVCLWSLSTPGAKEESTWVQTLSDVYYYSYATIDSYSTHDLLLRKISLPNLLTMLLPLDPLAVFLGGRYAPDTLKLSTDWQPNDGVVNTISMSHDGVGTAVSFAGSSQIGKWNKMPQLNRLDHLAVIGVTLHTQVLDLYFGHAKVLASLPASSSSRRLADSPAAVEQLDAAILSLAAATTSVETKSDLEALCESPKNSYAESYCTKMLEAAPSTRRLPPSKCPLLGLAANREVEVVSTKMLAERGSAAVARATNTYPVVLVHGFAGWGRDELLGLKYWGGIQGDLQEELVAQGYTVYTASIGPFSSNWDRACELYAQIKGGVTDYGIKHSANFDHDRYGKNYTGLYPEWGETNSDGSMNKIHLIGHSMGGQTIRMLAQMLEGGTTGAPVEEDSSTVTSPLFEGGHNWVHSITTISTPNQGTTLADGFSEIGDTVKDLLVSVINVLGIFGENAEMLYDAQLDQWGISAKTDDESLQEYIDRVFSSSIFDSGFKDVSIWSLSVAGAKEESTWVETLSDIYYYSYATIDTFSTYNWKLQKISYPNVLTMLLPLDVTSIFLGSRYAPDTMSLSTDWQPNDGAVNTISMSQDYVGELVSFDGTSVIGKWNEMTQLSGLDHLAVTGITLLYQILDLYEAHMALLYTLPTGSSSSRRLAANSTVTAKLNSAITSLNTATASIQTQGDLEALCENPINTYAENYCANMLNTTLVNDTVATANATVEAATNTSVSSENTTTRLRRG